MRKSSKVLLKFMVKTVSKEVPEDEKTGHVYFFSLIFDASQQLPFCFLKYIFTVFYFFKSQGRTFFSQLKFFKNTNIH